MRAKTLQIIWHSKDPVFSIDFHPDGYIATGGGDKDIKFWEVCCDNEGNPQVRFASSLSGHSRTINCVRFSHSGHCLASAGDSGELLIWRPAAGPAPGAAAAAGGHITHTPVPAHYKDSSTAGSLSRSSSQPLAAADEPGSGAADCSAAAVGVWKLSASLRGHLDDVTDVSWAHDDAVVMSGSVENEVMMFDVEARRTLARLGGHRHYVQGVAWDPLGAWMVSQSADRTVRVHGLKPPPTGTKAAAAAAAKEGMRSSTALARDVLHTHMLSKVALQPPATPAQPGPDAAAAAAAAASTAAGAELVSPEQQQQPAPKPLQAALFHDESLNTFFRRLAWSPDGALLAVPAGLYRQHAGQQPQHATYIYARGHWGCPLMSLPCPSKASTAARFCPRIFKLTPQPQQQEQQQQQQQGGSGDGGDDKQRGSSAGVAGDAVNVLGLPYRLVLAVATMDSVMLYDMQTCEPLMLVGPLHFAPITDIAWSRDGSCLAVSSHDGYCSIVTFQPGELGDVIDDATLPEGVQAALSKVQAAAAATAAKGGVTAGGPAAGSAAAAATPRPAAATACTPANTPKASQQQQRGLGPPSSSPANAAAAAGSRPAAAAVKDSKPAAGLQSGAAAAPAPAAAAGASRPRRLTPQSVAVDQGTPTPAFGAAAAPAPAVPAAAAPVAAAGAARRRRVTPQLVAVDEATAAPAFSAATLAPAAPAPSTGASGANPTPGQHAAQQQQQQQQHPAAKAKPPVVAAAATAPKAAAAAGGGASRRVGLAAVQAALAAAKKKRAAAQGAAEEGGGGDDDVVIVAEVAGDAGTSKRPKLQ